MSRRLSLTLIVASVPLFLGGCPKKASGPPPRRGAPAADAGIEPPRTPPPKRTRGPVGVAACDVYITAFTCVIGKMPAAARASSQKALERMRRLWHEAAADPNKRGPLQESCQTAYAAWRKGMANSPRYADCFKP